MKFLKEIFLNKFFYYAMSIIAFGFCVGFFFPIMFQISQLALFGLIIFTLVDFILLFSVKKTISGEREVNDKLSNSDKNIVKLKITNHFPFRIRFNILDEIPEQFQIFDFKMKGFLSSKKERILDYDLTPHERGIYKFGDTNVFVLSPLRILQRKVILKTEKQIKVYPSFLRLNQYSLKNFRAHVDELGSKKVRRIGHSMEFEQIKNYVRGDDIRTINWKSTAKHKKLMINQYVDEKSQQIYCAIDKGRVMKMPFNELTLLDYAVNASLVLSNVVLQNQDRAGIFTFSGQLENLVKAERRTNQLQKILESLYGIQTNFMESDFGKLYKTIKHKITQRGLIVLFTNFESMDALHRQLPYLLGINKNHLLLVVFFRNTELEDYLDKPTEKENPYETSIIEKFIYEKEQIVRELNKYGIQTILTRPEDLNVNTINKYLEIKSKGMI
ncbi:DUF58 domain-containing protein [Moheibacter sediminis]|uniref:Uncharacterized conserved protein, DUF58 family, contains vWF domain n=1 Tax=Moheibacter sediminis TaxID=1434700 RepID=A0A1W1ZY91_9FLAO|nr:DUF58 domain-containing protein [Moheibacter sediminis]SMC53353.1 Uncharacterized conserved protein, DUF58 family, contains vWF domain [Moheibacter sediminis]